MAEMERLAAKRPSGFDHAWTGQSLQEKLSGSQAVYRLALSLFCVFLCLAALFESWSIPLAQPDHEPSRTAQRKRPPDSRRVAFYFRFD
ncbi:hypothetical protein MPOCJGCO_1490 [Methylobacterium trifolii]|uniref:Uncharacterized protein n=1 Tax=Methylobacterium trifolii TaxID=1003092 RepID=A0ABQ4TVV4_9HYPH|nr:efflux RND transporter permease subunit [Methylobacterium trifolii]GJE59399.1 hypothetical protein MPOCJGCO_1490 [Methylobacterium trifolii]